MAVDPVGGLVINFQAKKVLLAEHLNMVQRGKADVLDGVMARTALQSASLDSESVAAPSVGDTAVAFGQMIADVHVLRAWGCKLDGVTDDKNALSALIAYAQREGAGLVVDLPFCTMLLSAPPANTGALNIAIRGRGEDCTRIVMAAGGSGIWQHGTIANPATGYFSLDGVTLEDANPQGSGSVALSICGARGTLDGCVRISHVKTKNFSGGMSITNIRRGLVMRSVYITGPAYSIQSLPGIFIAATADFIDGCYSYSFDDIEISNYQWGLQYSVASALEGQLFRSLRVYNGWGGVQVRNTAPAGYLSLMWSFLDCDWQGLGFALDLEKCRLVMSRGGYWIANVNTKSLALPNTATRRRYFQFLGCEDVLLDSMEWDVLPGQDTGLSLAYCDGACVRVCFRDITIKSFSSIYAAYEWDSNAVTNTISELDTVWAVWSGGLKILDQGDNQVQQSCVRDSYSGDATRQGRYTVTGYLVTGVTDAQGQITVDLPVRYSGKPLFLAANPPVFTSVNLNNSMLAPSLISYTQSSFTVAFSGDTGGTKVGLSYSVQGE